MKNQSNPSNEQSDIHSSFGAKRLFFNLHLISFFILHLISYLQDDFPESGDNELIRLKAGIGCMKIIKIETCNIFFVPYAFE